MTERLALITGASRGLGEEIAIALARTGASVAMVARDMNALAAAAQRVRAARIDGKQVVYTITSDLSVATEPDRVIDDCVNALGGIDVLINNAGVQQPIGALERIDFDAWRAAFDINLFAPARLCQRVIPIMRARGGGKIINISGGGAANPRPDVSAYAVSKCALVRLTETLAEELKAYHIDVNAVAPGPMNTRMLDEVIAAGPRGAPREYEAALKRAHEGGTPLATPAALIELLISPACDGITGRLISAVWDDWQSLPQQRETLASSDRYTLRRIK